MPGSSRYISRGFMEYICAMPGSAGTFLIQRGFMVYNCAMPGSSRYVSPSERVHGVHLRHARVQQVRFSLREGSWSTFAPCQAPEGTFLLQSGFLEYICAIPGSSRYVSPSERVHAVHLRHARVQQERFSFREGSWSTFRHAVQQVHF
jgi:hypothetical protein